MYLQLRAASWLRLLSFNVSHRKDMRLVILSLALASTLCAAEPRPTPDRGYLPPSGMVPDAETAIAIAVAIWKPIYGAEEI